jgi:predicted PurR-regulated permease PerM
MIAKENPTLRILVTMASLVVIVAGISAAQAILVPFFFAVFVSVISYGIFFRLKRFGLSSFLASVVILVLLVIMIVSLIYMVQTAISQFGSTIGSLQEQFIAVQASVDKILADLGVPILSEIIGDNFDFESAMQFFLSLLSAMGSMLTYALLVLAMVMFILMEAAHFPEKLQEAFKEPGPINEFIQKINQSIEQYFFIKTVLNLLSGLFVGLWAMLFGVEFAILWGLLTFLLNFIPYFGAIIAAIPLVVFALLTAGLLPAVAMIIAFIVLSLVIGNFIEPRYLGRGMDLSILVIFISMLFWGWILGPLGMIFTVPLTVAIKIVLEIDERTHWIAVLLSAGSLDKPS